MTAARNFDVNSVNTNINSSRITLGATNGTSTVVLPGLKGTNEGFVTVHADGTVNRSSFSVMMKDALQKVGDGINQVGAMAMAVSAIPNLIR